MKAALANALWVTACLPEWRRFQTALTRVTDTQADLLRQLLRTNQHTHYGQRYDFAGLRSVADYQQRVPLTTYDDYIAPVERIGQGEANVLTVESVKLLEPSSGSTAASKLIPYTTALQAEFQRGLAPWIFDLYTHHPDLLGGPAYWSISPLTDGERMTSGGLPIGFEDDSAYLGGLGQVLSNAALAVPSVVKYIGEMAAFRYVTLLSLLHQRGLRLMSVWNPTFLMLLLAPLAEWWDSLITDVRHGTVTPPFGGLAPSVREALRRRWRPNPRRANELRGLNPQTLTAIWPRLRLISCWADGASADYARQLAQLFPQVTIQGKGLLATEAFVSLPLIGVEGAVLAMRSHFFEFLPTRGGEPRLAQQLDPGQTYAVVVTTGGGLYRYQLRDVVEVLGYLGQAPRLRFVGKTDHVSDWFGEKLDEGFVTQVLAQACRAVGVSPLFLLLAPDDAPSGVANGFRYTVYVEAIAPARVEPLGAEVERGLGENFHYAYCRKLGQLGAVRVQVVGPRAAEAYLRACVARGQKLGNIKPSLLQKTTGWGAALANRPVDMVEAP